jgi:hypothetical protein
MNPASLKILTLALAAGLMLAFPSCTSSTEDLKYKLEKKNERYFDWQQRRKMRTEARQKRTDAWFDRIMH